MQSKQILIAGFIVLSIAVIVGGYFISGAGKQSVPSNQEESAGGDLAAFAKCLGEKGAIFYGAFWCPHCQNQKAMFGDAAESLPYVECSTPDGQGQRAICSDKQVTGYPTWVYADGTRESGEIPLARLAEKTGCSLPQQ